eukprot:1160775-Pelagomonas_calceolata.AAC.13
MHGGHPPSPVTVFVLELRMEPRIEALAFSVSMKVWRVADALKAFMKVEGEGAPMHSSGTNTTAGHAGSELRSHGIQILRSRAPHAWSACRTWPCIMLDTPDPVLKGSSCLVCLQDLTRPCVVWQPPGGALRCPPGLEQVRQDGWAGCVAY